MATASEPIGAPAAIGDPYALDPAKIKEPPKGWGPSVRFLGPGMITSAAVVGSGELITATTLGAEVGFLLLWLVFVSTFVKVAVQIEVARWSISTGQSAIEGYNRVPPRFLKRGWVSYLAVLMFLQFLTSQAGVLSAAGLALSLLVPIGGDSPSTASVGFWVLVMVVVAIAIHIANRYGIVEKVSTVLVVIVTAAVVVLVFGIQATPFAWSISDLAGGMQFQLAAGTMGVALAMFGLTGVGAGEITSYSFWCVEKGYAAWTGPNDGSEAWVRRARGWISVMKKDVWVAWVIYTTSTASFYILGAAVLNPQGLVPAGNEVLTTISRIFTDTVGDWVGVVFLAFAALALYKTILANVPSLSRQVANAIAVFGVFDWKDSTSRDRWLRGLMVVQPILWGVLGVVAASPLALVILGGILNALYLVAVSVASLYLSFRETDPRIKDGRMFTVYLVVSAIAIFAVGAISLYDMF
ncbi:Nramp family divalent metal transporter [Mycobacterium sp. GA-1199]|uniref:Nramp family divalent metal transporter n=1 Tax=Mycobacterium sp. GA-1199 TaxID=1772287 RepID=UPI000A8941D1|nr:Nramp family divalent metal transporter [Mycobacterium sp. GA-1199]